MEKIGNRKIAIEGLFLFSLFLLLFCLTVANPTHAEEQEFTLTILHTNDVHAHLLPFTQAGGECTQEDDQAGKCFGGVARQYSLIEQLREQNHNVILLDAGDQFQGTLFYNEYKGKTAQQFMNAFQYHAMTLGNHEFDDGPAVLADFIKGLNFPVICSNIDVSREPSLTGLIKPYILHEAGGERIGVIGATTIETTIMSSPGEDVVFKDVKESVNQAVSALQNLGVNKIIVLSHIGYGPDQELAAAVPGIDIIVGGHSHTYLASASVNGNIDQPAGEYPTVVISPAGEPVLIVQAFWMGKYLGRLNVTFDHNGKLIAWDGQPILLDSSIKEDHRVQMEVEKLNQPLAALRNKVIGDTKVDLIGERNVCRFNECNLGDLITDAMLAKTEHLGTELAILNGGSIRSSITKGKVTLGMVLTTLPFGNALSVFEMKGEDVWAALEHGVSRAENPNNDGTGRFPQVSGIRFWWDENKPIGSRVIAVEVKDKTGNYIALDKERIYKVVSIDYTRRGGDGYAIFQQKAIDPEDDSGYLADAVAEYIAVHSPIDGSEEGRINRGTPKYFHLSEYSRNALLFLPVTSIILALILFWCGVFREDSKIKEKEERLKSLHGENHCNE